MWGVLQWVITQQIPIQLTNSANRTPTTRAELAALDAGGIHQGCESSLGPRLALAGCSLVGFWFAWFLFCLVLLPCLAVVQVDQLLAKTRTPTPGQRHQSWGLLLAAIRSTNKLLLIPYIKVLAPKFWVSVKKSGENPPKKQEDTKKKHLLPGKRRSGEPPRGPGTSGLHHGHQPDQRNQRQHQVQRKLRDLGAHLRLKIGCERCEGGEMETSDMNPSWCWVLQI